MKRYAIVLGLLVSFGSLASAQVPPPIAKQPPATGGPVAQPAPRVIPISAAKPPQGFYKSGGVLVGSDGYFPFDTGDYLLGGTQGLTRYSGTFYVIPTASAATAGYTGPTIEASSAIYSTGRHRFFHRH